MDNTRRDIFLCGPAALGVWQRLRGACQPRLDRLEPLPGILGRAGARPAPIADASRVVASPADARARAAGALAALRLPKSATCQAASFIIDEATPLDLMVGRLEARRKGARCHVWSGPVPPGGFLCLGDGVHLASPELVFLQLAREMPLAALLPLGFEVCGAYATGRFGGQAWLRCPPLTTRRGLMSFLDSAGSAHGVSRARRAARHMADGSASAGETAVSVLACTPRMLGGYGLPLPEMNYRLDVPAKLRPLLGRGFMLLDAYWPDARFALEYDGERFHTSPDDVARDRRRDNVLAMLGVTAVRIDRRMLFNAEQLDKVVRQAARAIGYRLPSDALGAAWSRKRLALRESVLYGGHLGAEGKPGAAPARV